MELASETGSRRTTRSHIFSFFCYMSAAEALWRLFWLNYMDWHTTIIFQAGLKIHHTLDLAESL